MDVAVIAAAVDIMMAVAAAFSAVAVAAETDSPVAAEVSVEAAPAVNFNFKGC